MTSKDPLPQSRHLATAIPGPKSQELIARRKEAVSAGLGMAIPAFIERGEAQSCKTQMAIALLISVQE